MELQKILHHFIGIDVKTPNGIGKLIGIVKDEAFVDYRGYTNKGYVDEFGTEYDFVFQENEYPISEITPILRNLIDITEVEALEIGIYKKKVEWHEPDWNKVKENLQYALNDDKKEIEYSAKEVVLLTAKEFDLFGLIKSKIAMEVLAVAV